MDSIFLKPVAITFIGMSNVGKSTNAGRLEGFGWVRFSSDEFIAEYMEEELDKYVEPEGLAEDRLAKYLGQIGKQAVGGLSLEEFKRRQRKYYEAELASLLEVRELRDQAFRENKNFVFDSTGSLCEIDDYKALEDIRDSTRIVYIEATAEVRQKVIDRAQKTPKPLFFPPDKLEEWWEAFLEEKGYSDAEDVTPGDFSTWVVPTLMESRGPKYENLAEDDMIVASSVLEEINTGEEFLEILRPVVVPQKKTPELVGTRGADG